MVPNLVRSLGGSACILSVAIAIVGAQTPTTWKTRRMADGQPDLQGVRANNNGITYGVRNFSSRATTATTRSTRLRAMS